MKYREAATLPAVIPELVQRPAGPIELPATPVHAPPPADPTSTGPRFSRVSVADEVGLDDPDRIAILTVSESREGHVSVLGGIAPAVWRAADGATLPQFVDAAITAYDEPEDFDAGAAVLVAVGHLLDAGLLTSDEPALARRETCVGRQSATASSPCRSAPIPDLQLAQPAALTGSAALIWEWLEEPVTRTQLTARATEAAGVAHAADVVAQVETFLAQLTESRLVAEAGR